MTDTYNPHYPQILGNEWVPIRDQDIEFAPVASVERGYRFSLQNSLLESANYGLTQVARPNLFDSSPLTKAIGVSLYRAGGETQQGPVRVVTLPCSAATVTGGTLTSTSVGQIVAFRYSGTPPATATGGADFFFDVTPYEPLLYGKRILNVSLLYAGYLADFDGTTIGASSGRAIPFVYPAGILPSVGYLTTINHHLLTTNPAANGNIPYLADNAPYGMGSLPQLVFNEQAMQQLDTANPNVSPLTIGSLSLGAYTRIYENANGGFAQPQWSYDDLLLLKRFTAAGCAIRLDVILPATSGATASNGYPRLTINYMALRVAYCEETRVLVNYVRPTPLTTINSLPGLFGLSRPGSTQSLLRDPARHTAGLGTSSLLTGDYTVTVGYADQGEDGVRNRSGNLPILGTRELYQVPSIPGVQVNVPFPATDDTVVGKTFTAEDSHIMPQILLWADEGTFNQQPVQNYMLNSHVYGRQTVGQVYGDFIVTQDIGSDVTAPSNNDWPYTRFYARRFGTTPVPLRIQGLHPKAGLLTQGVAGQYASSPDANKYDSDNLFLVAEVTMNSPESILTISSTLIAKYVSAGNQCSFLFQVTPGGILGFQFSPTGADGAAISMTSVTPAPWGRYNNHLTVAVAFVAANPGRTATFYYAESPDSTFRQLGNTASGAGSSIFNGTAPIEISSRNAGSSDNQLIGVMHSAKIYSINDPSVSALNPVNLTLLASPDFAAQTPGTISFNDSMGNAWTVNGTASISANQGVQGVYAEITAEEFDELDELTDGWKQVTLEMSEPPDLASPPITTWQFTATGSVAGDRWEILGAAAPTISGGIPGSTITPVPDSLKASNMTYEGALSNESWMPQNGPYAYFGVDQTADVSIIFSQAAPAVSGLDAVPGVQLVEGIGQECGINPCCVPDAIFYNELSWDMPPYTSYVVDSFERETTNGWGSTDTGESYSVITGTAAEFRVDDDTGIIDLAATDAMIGFNVGTDFDITVTLGLDGQINLGGGANGTYIRARYTDANNNYQLLLKESTNLFTLELHRIVSGTDFLLASIPIGNYGNFLTTQNNQTPGGTVSGYVNSQPNALVTTMLGGAGLRVRWEANKAMHRVWIAVVPDELPVLPTFSIAAPTGLYLPNASGAYASTPDATSLDIVGDIDIRVELTPQSVFPSTNQTIIAKMNATGNQRSWWLTWLSGVGGLRFSWSANGTAITTATVNSPFDTIGRLGLRVTLDIDDGSGNRTITFWKGPSINGPWLPFDKIITAGVVAIFNSTAPLTVGIQGDGTTEPFLGIVHQAEVRNLIDGNVVANPQFNEQAPGSTASFIDGTGKTWTINGTAVINGTTPSSTGTVGFGSMSVSGFEIQSKFQDLVITPPRFNFGSYELQRSDTVETEWKTIMKYTNPGATSFNDFEARIGIESFYRIRAVDAYDFPGPWSSEVSLTMASPGISGGCVAQGHILVFTSNEHQDGAINLAYASVWESGQVNEPFSFPEASFVQLQPMFERDFYVAFRPTERGGEQFTRSVLVQAAAIAPETLADFVSLRDMAWDAVNYICVRDEDGNRWFANVNVPNGKVTNYRKLYIATVSITEVTDTPTPVDQTWPF